MTFKRRKTIIQDRFKDSKIKCDPAHPTYENILEALYVLTYMNPGNLKTPRGFHIRTRFTDSMNLAEYSAHIRNFFIQKSSYNPPRITVCETDNTGVHHHHALVIDDSKDRIYSLHHLHAKLKKAGRLADYSIIPPTQDRYGNYLITRHDQDRYFEWMSYIAKTKSKLCRHQMWSGSRSVTSSLFQWRAAGKPKLNPPANEDSPLSSTACDLSDFMGLPMAPLQATLRSATKAPIEPFKTLGPVA